MGLGQVTGSGQGSILESLKLGTKQKSEGLSPEVAKYVQIPSDIVVGTKTNKKGPVPQVDNTIAKDFIPSVNTPLIVGNRVFTNIRKVTEGMELDDAKKITTDNSIDEIFFKTEDGQMYLAYGGKETKGALDLDQMKEGYVGKFGNQTAKIVHLDNETNTIKEGAISPLKSTWGNVKEAGTTGIAKGITEMGTTLVAMFVGKSLIQNGITAVQESGKATEAVAGGANIIKNGAKIVGDAGKTGKVIVSTMGSGLKQVAVGAAIAGVVVVAVAGSMSVYGALSARKPKNDYNTIDMITDPYLSYVPKKTETEKK